MAVETTIQIRFTFDTGGAAWSCMRVMDAAGLTAGWPDKCGGYAGRSALQVELPASQKDDVIDVAYNCGALSYAQVQS